MLAIFVNFFLKNYWHSWFYSLKLENIKLSRQPSFLTVELVLDCEQSQFPLKDSRERVRKSLVSNTAALIRTVICSWRSVSFARTVTLAYGPWFAVDGPYASHGPSFLLADRYLRLTVRTFRTDRHSYLQSENRACISLSRQGQLLTVRTFRTDRHHCLRTVIYDSRSVCRGINSLYKYDWASLFKGS